MRATTVTLATADGDMRLYDVEPDGAARGAVIVVQEAFGVNSHIEDVTRRVASAGYRAVAPHLYHRSGDPVVGYTEYDKLLPHFKVLSAAGLENDLGASLKFLADAGFGPKHVGVVGFCMGGTVTFLAAVQYALGAAVTFYGGGVAEGRFNLPPQLELARDLQTPWLGFYGGKDRGIPVKDVESLRAAVVAARVPTEIVRYDEAGHGFHCDQRPDYHEASANDAWRRALEWFERFIEAP